MPLFFCLRNQFLKQTENRPPEFPEPNGGNGGRENPEAAQPEALPCRQLFLDIDLFLFDFRLRISRDAVLLLDSGLGENRYLCRLGLQRVVKHTSLDPCLRHGIVIFEARCRVLCNYALHLPQQLDIDGVYMLYSLRPDFHFGAVVCLDTGYCMS